jgi:hypothetical protein
MYTYIKVCIHKKVCKHIQRYVKICIGVKIASENQESVFTGEEIGGDNVFVG